MREVLYSPGCGWGWTTWYSGTKEQKLFMLEHPGLIAAVKAGESLYSSVDCTLEREPTGPLADFVREFKERWPGAEVPYLGGAESLVVCEVPDGALVHITEYYGCETVNTESDIEWL